MTMYSVSISLVLRAVYSRAMCIILGVPSLPTRPSDERLLVMYGHFCLVTRVSVNDRCYCIENQDYLRLSCI